MLERVLGEIVRRHETLRTRFVTVDGEPSQVIDAGGFLGIRRSSSLQLFRRASERPRSNAWQVEHAQKPFDLAEGPLFRAELYCV